MKSKTHSEPMRKSDLMDIGIKIFGLYFLVIALIDLKNLLLTWLMELSFSSESGGPDIPFSMQLPYILNILLDGLIAWFLLFRSRQVARVILKGENEREADFAIDKKSAVQIAAFVLGGLIVTNVIQFLGVQLIDIYQTIKSNVELRPNVIPELIWECVYGAFGYALIGGSGVIAEWMFRNKEQKTADETEASQVFPQWKLNFRRMRSKRPLIPYRKPGQTGK